MIIFNFFHDPYDCSVGSVVEVFMLETTLKGELAKIFCCFIGFYVTKCDEAMYNMWAWLALKVNVCVGNNAACAVGLTGKVKVEYNTTYMQVIKTKVWVGCIILGSRHDEIQSVCISLFSQVWNMPCASQPP
jgi:hypothetical protein